MKEKIIEIVRKEIWSAFKQGQGVSPFDADNSEFWSPHYDLNVAPRIATEIDTLYKPEIDKMKERLDIQYKTIRDFERANIELSKRVEKLAEIIQVQDNYIKCADIIMGNWESSNGKLNMIRNKIAELKKEAGL